MDKNPASITIQNVSKTFESGHEAVHALKEINLTIFPGEITMIVGPSGSGKTTLLSCIAGTLHFDTGTIFALDKELKTLEKASLSTFRAYNIGYIFQEFHLIPTLTCVENVSIPLLIQNNERKGAFSKAKQVLEKVGLADKFDRLPKELSGGQEQRVAIARAIVHEPPIIICDEPTASLDLATGLKIMDLLQELAKDPNRSVIIVTHDARIFHYASKIVAMDDGRIKETIKNHTR